MLLGLALTCAALPCLRASAQPAPQWIEQGPGPAPGDGGLVSGAIQAIAADPADPNRVFVATVGGGIWRTENATDDAASSPTCGGPCWTPLTDHEASLSMRDLVFDPLDATHNTLYGVLGVTTHAVPLTGGGNPLNGVLKTVDGGSHWSLMSIVGFEEQRVMRFLPTSVTTIHGQVLFAVTAHPLIDAPGGGVYRSMDGGQSWEQRSGSAGQPANGLPDFTFVDIVQDPSNPERLFTATDNPPRLFRSEDLRDTWTELSDRIPLPTNTFNEVKLELSPSAGATGRHWLYMLVQRGPGIFFSTDSGNTWTAMDQPPTGDPWGGRWPTVTISQSAPQIVFAVNGNPGHWRGDASAAPGSQWYQVDGANAGGTGVHVDVRDWVFSADPNVMFESDDGGIYRLRNPFSNAPRWDPAVGNIRVTEFLSVAYDSVHDTIFGASWDNAVPHQTIPGDIRWG